MEKERKLSEDFNDQDKLSRDKNKSKIHLLDNFDKMVMKDGITNTTLKGLSENSGKALSLIYKYFEGKEGLIFELLKTPKYGILSAEDLNKFLAHHMADNGIELYKLVVNFQFYHMNTNRFVQDVHMMKLTENTELVSNIIDLKENFREKFLVIGNDYFRNTSIDFPAINFIIQSGLAHSALYANNTNKGNFGFTMNNSYQRARVLNAANSMIDLVYNQGKRDKLDG